MPSLLVTAASPVLQAGLLAAAGAALAWKGVLDSAGTNVMAGVCFYMLTPALTFSNLASSVSIDSIRHFWPLLLNMAVSSVVGMIIGHFAGAVLHSPPEFRRMITAAIAFGNVGNLPLVFVNALCGDKSAVFYKTLGERCESVGIAYVAFDICSATVFQFTIALQLLRPPRIETLPSLGGLGQEIVYASPVRPNNNGNNSSSVVVNDLSRERPRTLSRDPTLSDLMRIEEKTSSIRSAENSPREPSRKSGGLRVPAVLQSNVELQPMRGRSAPPLLVEEDSAWLLGNNNPSNNGESPQLVPSPKTHTTTAGGLSWVSTTINWVKNIEWKSIFPLPTQAAILGVIVGCVPALRHLLYGESPPLQVVADAMRLLANGLIPGAIPVLGAVLWRGPGESKLPWRVTAGVVVTRLLLQPALLTAVLVLCLHFNLFTVPDPMFLLTMLLANSTPTAINLQMVTVLYGHGAEEMSQLLFWQYLCSLATLPLYTRLFLSIIHSFSGAG